MVINRVGTDEAAMRQCRGELYHRGRAEDIPRVRVQLGAVASPAKSRVAPSATCAASPGEHRSYLRPRPRAHVGSRARALAWLNSAVERPPAVNCVDDSLFLAASQAWPVNISMLSAFGADCRRIWETIPGFWIETSQ